MNFFWAWLGFLFLMLAVAGGFLAWAVASGQFRQQRRARYLPLYSGIPAAGDAPPEEVDDAAA